MNDRPDPLAALKAAHGGNERRAWVALGLGAIGPCQPHWLDQIKEATDESVRASSALVLGSEMESWLATGAFIPRLERHFADVDDGALEDRRNSGSYFTPLDLIELVVRRALGPVLKAATTPADVLKLRVLDPAVGGGGFLLEVARQLTAKMRTFGYSESQARTAVVRDCLYGVDVNPYAVLLTAASLSIFSGSSATAVRAVQWADFVLPPPVFSAEWAGAPPLDPSVWFGAEAPRFDVVVGNPPWGAVKPAIREYMATRDPSLLQMQGAELKRKARTGRHGVAWEQHAEAVRDYAKALRLPGWYAHQGRGDADLYRYFVERAHQLVGERGRVALLVPAALLRADGAGALRELLLETGTIEHLVEFVNTQRIFDIHSMFRFVMFVWQRGVAHGIRRASFGARSVSAADDEGPAVRVTFDFLKRVGGKRLTVPEVRNEADVQLLGRLYGQHPLVGDAERKKRIRFVRELDMTNDSAHFIHAHDLRRQGQVVPLYEGRLVNQFDDRAKRYIRGAGRTAEWAAQGLGRRELQPHFTVPATLAARVTPGSARAGFCDVTGHANERTILAALIPGDAVAGNKVPTLRIGDGDQDDRDHLLWLAFANSFVVDWIARRRVSTTLNFFHLEQLPMPDLDLASGEAERICQLSAELVGSVSHWTLESLRARATARAELDALIARTFGLAIEELAHVLADFPLLDRHQPTPWTRATITRDLVLTRYALLLYDRPPTFGDLGLPPDDGPCDPAERVAVATEYGQIAFVPGELAKILALSSRDGHRRTA